jgi:formylglycine-generating enzyme required for sulfatase activity
MYAAAMLMPLIEAKKLEDWWASMRRMASKDIANMIGDARAIYRGENRESIARELTMRLCRPSNVAGIANLMEEMRDPYRGWKVLSALLTVRDVKRPEAPRDFKILFAVLLIEAGKTAIEAVWGNAVYDFLKSVGEHLQKQIAPTQTEGTSKTSSVAKLDTLVIESPIHLELVRVREGKFSMGSDRRVDPKARDDEIPQHRVYLSEYYIGRFPVTVSQFESFVRATGYRTTAELGRDEFTWRTPRRRGSNIIDKANHPVTRVTWDDAVAFCAWLKRATGMPFRLPTEAEWEKAARGTDGQIYPWGNTFDSSKLNSLGDFLNDTTPVDKYPSGKSPYHAFDMVGNVWEWCADWYDENEYKRRANRVVRDPTGPSHGKARVVRGGSWLNKPVNARAANRNWNYNHNYSLGFRVVCASAPVPNL